MRHSDISEPESMKRWFGCLRRSPICVVSGMALPSPVRYRSLMRKWFAAIMIVLFTGVHTAAAFAGARPDVSSAADAVGTEFAGPAHVPASHHVKCCETSEKTGAVAKVSGCSADCVSLHTDGVKLRFPDAVPPEALPEKIRFGSLPVPHLRPPKNV